MSQVRRYVYHDVIRLDDLEKLVDCSNIQVRQISAKEQHQKACRFIYIIEFSNKHFNFHRESKCSTKLISE